MQALQQQVQRPALALAVKEAQPKLTVVPNAPLRATRVYEAHEVQYMTKIIQRQGHTPNVELMDDGRYLVSWVLLREDTISELCQFNSASPKHWYAKPMQYEQAAKAVNNLRQQGYKVDFYRMECSGYWNIVIKNQ